MKAKCFGLLRGTFAPFPVLLPCSLSSPRRRLRTRAVSRSEPRERGARSLYFKVRAFQGMAFVVAGKCGKISIERLREVIGAAIDLRASIRCSQVNRSANDF